MYLGIVIALKGYPAFDLAPRERDLGADYAEGMFSLTRARVKILLQDSLTLEEHRLSAPNGAPLANGVCRPRS